MPTHRPKEVFISYAQQDSDLARKLISAIQPLEREGLISLWTDRRIEGGMDWREPITKRLGASDLILLLLSADYLASDYCWGLEMKAALDNYKQGRSHLLPILLRPCDWRSTPLGDLRVLPHGAKPISQWGNTATALTDVVTELRNVLSHNPLPQIARSEKSGSTELPSVQPSIWNLPYSRDAGFVGRKEELAQLHEKLRRADTLGRPVIVTGLGGVGKSALAVEYAYQYAAGYAAIWWIRANHEQTVGEDLAALAGALGLGSGHALQRRYAVEFAREWLSQHRNWLLIFDNVQESHLFDSICNLPPGRLLVTSRVLSWRSKAEIVPLLPLSDADAKCLISASGVHDPAIAEELAAGLAGHPLALRVASAYLETSGPPPGLGSETEKLRGPQAAILRSWVPIFSFRASPDEDRPRRIAAILEAVIDDLMRESTPERALLNVSAFLGESPIPTLVLLRALSSVSAPTDTTFGTEVVKTSISRLLELNLLIGSEDELLFHSLVQSVTRERLSDNERKYWVKLLLVVLAGIFPDTLAETQDWNLCSVLLPHASTVIDYAEGLMVGEDAVIPLLMRLGDYLGARGEYADAQQSFQHALKIIETTGSSDPAEGAMAHQRLGSVCEQMGDLISAAEYYRRSLSILKPARPLNVRAFVHLTQTLARVLQARGELDESAELLRGGVQLATREQGENSPLVGRLLAQISDVQRAMGQFSQAKETLEQAIRISELRSDLGSNERLSYQNRLGVVLGELGDLRAAQDCFETALLLARQINNPIACATALNNLGATYRGTGNLDRAIECYQNALAVNQTLEYRDPRSMGMALKNLGEAYLDGNRFEEARTYLEHALHVLEVAYGPTHDICRSVSEQLARTAERK